MRLHTNNSGFTIIETLISIILLVIIMTGGTAMTFNTDRLLGWVKHKRLATELVNSKLEEIKALGFSGTQAAYGACTVLAPCKIPVTLGGLENDPLAPSRVYNIVVEDIAGETDILRVNVGVKWLEPEHQTTQLVQAATFLAK